MGHDQLISLLSFTLQIAAWVMLGFTKLPPSPRLGLIGRRLLVVVLICLGGVTLAAASSQDSSALTSGATIILVALWTIEDATHDRQADPYALAEA
ncbi:hypothetical protein Pan216_54080 [Planctomycetes bacterium Pan216]|uniref:Uncharacterized protein n=1 Tax=Kolteria novifilia TaxID=2527975 RepID=A0A518BC06_9BACT|nr:hypothetical protein Pan216_54080 [Planctomycetes bacterium Pan216]